VNIVINLIVLLKLFEGIAT